MMKLKDLLKKLDDSSLVFINGEAIENHIDNNLLEKEIIKIDIKIDEDKKDDLESLGYSFEVGV